MQVRITPRKSGPITKKSIKKRTAQANAARSEYPSTNISSPIRGPPKRRIQNYVLYEDEDGSVEKNARQKRRNRNNHFEADGFVVADDKDDEDYEDEDDFEPIRIGKAKPLVSKRGRALGRPITIDERIANLDDIQRDLLDHFMVEAKKMAKKILVEKSLRNQPFSDTILREMGLDLPQDEAQLLNIPGINPDMVEHYGRRFLRLIGKYRQIYGPNAPRSKAQGEDEDNEDMAPMDPNHQNVIDLVTSESEEEQEDIQFDEESNYSLGEDEDDESLHVSHHFTHSAMDPRVEEYNRRGSQLEADKTATTSSRARSVSKAPTKTASKSRTLPWKKSGSYRRKSSGNHRGYSGVSKKGFAKKPSARKGSGSVGGAKKPSGGGSRGGGGSGGSNPWGSVMAMPT